MKGTVISLEVVEDALKDAVHELDAWPTALEAIDAFLDGSGIVLLSVDERLKHAPHTANIEEMIEDYIGGGWYSQDLRENCVPFLRKQGYVLDFHFQDVSQIENTAYYQDFLRRHKQKWFAGVSVNIGDDLWCLAIQRSRAKGAFQLGDIPKLRLIQTRLAKAALAASGASRAWIAGALKALQTIDEAAFVLDWTGKLLHANQSAQQLLGNFIGRNGSLDLPSGEARDGLEYLRSNRTWKLAENYSIASSPFSLRGNLYRLEAISLLQEPHVAFSSAAVLARLRPHKPCLNEVFRRRFGFTDAECRIAFALLQGKSIKEVCLDLRISENTARSHLKKVFCKTNVTSQARLVSFMSSLN